MFRAKNTSENQRWLCVAALVICALSLPSLAQAQEEDAQVVPPTTSAAEAPVPAVLAVLDECSICHNIESRAYQLVYSKTDQNVDLQSYLCGSLEINSCSEFLVIYGRSLFKRVILKMDDICATMPSYQSLMNGSPEPICEAKAPQSGEEPFSYSASKSSSSSSSSSTSSSNSVVGEVEVQPQFNSGVTSVFTFFRITLAMLPSGSGSQDTELSPQGSVTRTDVFLNDNHEIWRQSQTIFFNLEQSDESQNNPVVASSVQFSLRDGLISNQLLSGFQSWISPVHILGLGVIIFWIGVVLSIKADEKEDDIEAANSDFGFILCDKASAYESLPMPEKLHIVVPSVASGIPLSNKKKPFSF